MKVTRCICLLSLLAFSAIAVVGCSEKAEPEKPAGEVKVGEDQPISEVQAQAETLSVEALKAAALKYKDLITAKKTEIEALTAKIKDIPIAEALGEEAKGLKSDLADLERSIKALTERFEVYYNKLKEKGADLSGLEL